MHAGSRDPSGETRRLIRDELRAAEGALHPAVIAGRLGLHVNTVRHHLDVLETSGEVRRHEEGDGRGRPRITYTLSTGPSQADRCEATGFVAGALSAYIAATEDDPHHVGVGIGEPWGRHLAQAPPFARVDREAAVEQVLALVEGLGFVGLRVLADGHLELDVGVAADLAPSAPELIAGLFLGVVTGAFDALGSPVADIQPTPAGAYRLRFDVPPASIVTSRRDRRPHVVGAGA